MARLDRRLAVITGAALLCAATFAGCGRGADTDDQAGSPQLTGTRVPVTTSEVRRENVAETM